MTPFYKFVRGIAKFVVAVFFREKCYGLENLPQAGSYVLCSNHTSLMDVAFLIAHTNRQIFFMAKQELFNIPVIGFIITKLGAFPVVRGGGAGPALQKAQEILNAGNVLGIFPEGTRKYTGAPARGKAGAALLASACKKDVLPVSIYHNGRLHIFSKVCVRFGNVISYNEIRVENEPTRNDIRRITDIIMNNITSMWEKEF